MIHCKSLRALTVKRLFSLFVETTLLQRNWSGSGLFWFLTEVWSRAEYFRPAVVRFVVCLFSLWSFWFRQICKSCHYLLTLMPEQINMTDLLLWNTDKNVGNQNLNLICMKNTETFLKIPYTKMPNSVIEKHKHKERLKD